MSTPIKREDIRKGDRIRRISSYEYIAASGNVKPAEQGVTYELIERPVVLPTVPGYYLVRDSEGQRVIELLNSPREWVNGNDSNYLQMEYITKDATFTLLRPVAEVAAEVLAEVRTSILSGAMQDISEFGDGDITIPLTRNIARIAAKFGTTL